jgi:hypothetical protein
VGPRAGLESVGEKKNRILPGIEPGSSSPSLYRMSYHRCFCALWKKWLPPGNKYPTGPHERVHTSLVSVEGRIWLLSIVSASEMS